MMATRPSCEMLWLTPGVGRVSRSPSEIGQEKQERNEGIRRTHVTRLEEPRAPLDFGAPPNVTSFPMAASQSAFHKPVSAEVVSILGDLVTLLGRLLFRCSVNFVCM
jgi:hypothetical protein